MNSYYCCIAQAFIFTSFDTHLQKVSPYCIDDYFNVHNSYNVFSKSKVALGKPSTILRLQG